MEPTYRMEPKVKFNHQRVEKLVQVILENRMKWATRRISSSKYIEDADELTMSITDEIRASARELSYERYRLVVVVNLGQLPEGSVADVLFASRCLWDPRFDAFAQATFRVSNVYAVAVVYAVYCE